MKMSEVKIGPGNKQDAFLSACVLSCLSACVLSCLVLFGEWCGFGGGWGWPTPTVALGSPAVEGDFGETGRDDAGWAE